MWYADDATAAGQLSPLLLWWKHLLTYGPMYGYFPNVAKTCLIVKPDQLDSIFNGINIQMFCEGQHHLGAAIGTRSLLNNMSVIQESKDVDSCFI